VLASAPGLVLAFYLLWFGAALLSIILYSSGGRLTLATMRASWLGGASLAGDLTMFFCAVKLTSIVDVTVIGAFQPALVLIAARRLFGEKMGRWDVFWILIAMVGVSVAVVGHRAAGHHQVIGDLLAVGALLCWSAYWIATKHASNIHHALEYTTSVGIVAAVVVTPVVLLSGQSLGRVEAHDWLWIGLLAIVPGSGNLVMNWAHRYVDASVSSVIVCITPLIAAFAAMVILGQSLTLVQIGGVVAGLGAIAVVAARHQGPSTSPMK
jgi:drug/metabolite transporter (DMT)-like permease